MLRGTVFADSYTADFNTAITTSDHAFQVASNWRHIVSTYTNYWDEESYVSYSYSATAGVDGSGALSCSTNQNSNKTYDLLVTPVVKGTVTIAAKTTGNYYTPQLSFFKITDNGDGTFTRGDQITVDVSAINASDYTTITIPVAEAGERIGIRSSYVWLDNFTATDATIIPEKKITIASAVPTATTGTLKWDQQANGKVLVSYTVTVTNVGDVDLAQGTEGFSVSIINRATGDVYGTVPVPQDLAKGETSEAFAVSAEVESTLWPNSYTYINMDLKENLFGSTVQRAQSTYNAYEPKFVFRAFDSSSTSSISTAESWGTITESTTKNFEIFNSGTAPLTIKSITLPEGFTSTNKPEIPEGGLVIAKGEKQALSITHNAAATGTFIGTLTIVYLDKDNAEQTYTLDFSAAVIGENTWVADFNNTKSSPNYPAGSIAEAGTYYDYQYISSNNYNNWLVGRNTSSYATENNKFITPKLHTAAGEKLAFDVKAGYSTTDEYFVKVYVSTDRKTWGDPVETYAYSTVGSNFTTKTITFETEGDYYVAFALYGNSSAIDNIIGLTKVNVAHDLYIKSVKWPDASVKSGTALQVPSVDIIPLTDESADAYTVKYIYGENVVNIDSKALTASASSSTSFSAAFTPVVETTTTYPGSKVVFEFTDGIKFETEGFDLTVTNEPIFHFLDSKPSSKWNEPKDRTAPITFGKVNAVKEQSFVIFNWGSAPLTVNSISLPEGFSTTTEFPLTVAAFNGENDGIDAACQTLAITLSATEANTYSGDMVITYSGNKTFTLPISGTKLDATKFFANFNDQNWPAGSIYQDNVSITYFNTGDYGLQSSSATKNLFITPKLTATEGDKLQFDASTRNSSYDGTVKMYISSDRETWGEPVKEMALSKTENTSKATYEYKFASAGDYYVAFELNEARVDDIYGLKLAEVAHDWKIASANIPAEAMQNVASTATINLLNLGLADEAAGGYTVTAYVDGKVAGTSTGVAIPMNHKLTDAGTQVAVNFLYPKVGTYKVYLEVKADNYSVTTEPVDVTFAEEVAIANAITIGTKTGNGRDYGFVDWYNNDGSTTCKTDILYPAAKLTAAGIKAGDKIKSIAFRSTSSSAKSFKAEVTSWVGLSTGSITYGTPDKANMQEIQVYTGTVDFPSNFESVINLTTPIVWDGSSDIRVYTEAIGQGSGNWVSAYYDYDSDINMSYKGTTKAAPLLYVTLAPETATLSGTVKSSADAAIAGATITLKADNGVEYTGTTDAEGAYSINVIQAGLDFTVTVEAENYEAQQFAYCLEGSNKTLDIKFYPELTLNNSETEVGSYKGKADVTIARSLKAGWNTVVLPVALTAEDITNAFGADAEVATFAGDEQNGDNIHINFTKAATVGAGVPFLLYLEAAPASAPVFTGKTVDFTINNVEGNVFDFVGTFKNKEANAGDYILSGGKFKKAAGGNAINAYRAYLKLKGVDASRVSLFVDGFLVEDEATAITGAKMNAQQENVYNLSGQKINNQLKKGIYIVNGKKVVVK